MRRNIWLSSLVLCGAVASNAAEQSTANMNIPAQPLSAALRQFAEETGLQMAFETSITDGKTAPAVKGNLTSQDALARLLKGTGLSYRFLDSRTVAVSPVDKMSADDADQNTGSSSAAATSPGFDAFEKVRGGENEHSNSFRVSQSNTASGSSSKTGEGAPKGADEGRTTIDEIIVTAQKREERLQDVPVPVSTVDTGALVDSNQLRVQDYYTQVPGLTASLNNSGAANLAIRGITTGDGASPTVGITIDDVPYGSSTVLGSGAAVPDIDPSELSRIEVLRGPQGTLYGASSIGGLMKFVTVDPSTDGVSGQVQAGVVGVHAGNEAGYGLRGAINVPLGDTLAVRASAFTRRDPGYIDNIGLPDVIQPQDKGVNRGDAGGGRVTALWRPSEDFKLKLSALFQRNRTNGSPNVAVGPGLGDLEQQAFRGSNGYLNKIEAYSAIATGNLGGGFDFTSVTGFSVNKTFLPQDLTAFYGDVSEGQFNVRGTEVLFEADTRKFSQEIRLNKSFGPWLDWLVGGFYTHESSSVVSPIVSVSNDGAQAGVLAYSNAPSIFSEYAAFTDLTFHLTSQFDLQVGGRESYNDQSYYQIGSGPLVGPAPSLEGPIRTHEKAFTYLVTPSFKVTSDTIVYARLASGYRPGGPNVGAVAFHAPPSFASDATRNYEIGVKSDLLSHRLTLDASVYRIDWKDMQIVAFNPITGASYEVNGSRARSQGVELSTQATPAWEGLTVSTWVSWNKSVLKESFAGDSSTFGFPGDRLPYVARFSGRLSIQQDFPVLSSLTGFLGGAVSYVGNRVGEFASVYGPNVRQTYPSYAQTDLRAGLKGDDWSVNLYCNNVTDKRGELNGGLNFFPPNAFNYIQPRTVGLNFTKKFGLLR